MHIELSLGQATHYGLVLSHTNICLRSERFIPERLVKEATKAINPIGHDFRTQGKLKQRGRYVVKGPNWVWSADGHDKLADFGFQIYGLIDGYSRFVLNAFVGVTNRCQVAIMKYFLLCVLAWGIPMQLRSDKGTEVDLMAESQYHLHRRNNPDLPFRKAYIFGTSSHNIRIES